MSRIQEAIDSAAKKIAHFRAKNALANRLPNRSLSTAVEKICEYFRGAERDRTVGLLSAIPMTYERYR